MNDEKNKATGYPSVDRPWLRYYSDEAIRAELPRMTAYEYIYHCNKDKLNETAINYFGNLITYAELFQKIDICARQFSKLGIKKEISSAFVCRQQWKR